MKSSIKIKLLKIFKDNLDRDCIFSGKHTIKFKRLLSYIWQINNFLKKNRLDNKVIVTQFENRTTTLIFYIATIFSKTTICPLDPKLPKARVNKILKLINSQKVIKKINLTNDNFFDDKLFNLNDHDFLITFSSGTSGEPKGILHSSDNILGISYSYCKLVKFNRKTKILHCLPEYYMAGIVNNFIAGLFGLAQIYVIDSFGKKSIFDIWFNIEKYKINLVYLVPSIYSMITSFSPKNAIKIIKKNKIKFLATSNNLYTSIRKNFFRKFKVKIRSCFGITEMGGPLTNEKSGDLKNDCGGVLINGCKVKIKKINRKKVFFFKSNFMCKNILEDGKKKKLKLDINGYFNSQDTGYIKNNKLFLTGRERDILKKGGELIQLKDIENTILNCRFIKEVAAISVSDELSDEKLYLYVVFNPKEFKQSNIFFLLNIIQKKMYKTEKPDKIIIVKKMPKTLSGKIIKRKLISINVKDKIREIIL